MYRINVPEPVEVKFPLGPNPVGQMVERIEKYSIEKFLEECLDNVPNITKGSENIRKWRKIGRIIEKSESREWSEDKYIILETDEYDTLKKGADAVQWSPRVFKQILDLYDAFIGAEKFDPNDKEDQKSQ